MQSLQPALEMRLEQERPVEHRYIVVQVGCVGVRDQQGREIPSAIISGTLEAIRAIAHMVMEPKGVRILLDLEEEAKPEPPSIARKPYGRVLIPDPQHGYTALLREFPGCVAEGETVESAYAALDRAAETWMKAAKAQGMEIPEPEILVERALRGMES